MWTASPIGVQLTDAVVVITGASSGLGRATAFELSRRGCAVVLAGRRRDALDATAAECHAEGAADVLVVETDVTSEDEVRQLAQAALDGWGRIDVWINNAGVTLYEQLEDGHLKEHRRVIETNLFGAIAGARAVVPVFRRQHRGVLINVGSVLSHVGQAFVPAYVISKFGVRGLSEALRVELADEPQIHVCSVFPYAIDTPHFEVAANRMGVAPHPLPPMQSPEIVARAIADVAERPRRVRYVPRSIALGVALHAIAPRITERLLLDTLRAWHFTTQEQLGDGNLYEPGGPIASHGRRRPLITSQQLARWLVRRLIRNQSLAIVRRFRRALNRARAAFALLQPAR